MLPFENILLESLDALESMAIAAFENVRCSDPPAKKKVFPFEEHPWGAQQLKNKVYVVPLDEELQYMALTFSMLDYTAHPDLYDAGVS